MMKISATAELVPGPKCKRVPLVFSSHRFFPTLTVRARAKSVGRRGGRRLTRAEVSRL